MRMAPRISLKFIEAQIPKKDDRQFPPRAIDKLVFNFSPGSDSGKNCGATQQEYNFGFGNLPFTSVAAYSNGEILNHAKEENVFLVWMNTGELTPLAFQPSTRFSK